jgi:hypothetical protein
MNSPSNVIAEYVGWPNVKPLIAALRTAGYIVVRADAIRLAQAHEREACRYEAANDNVPAHPGAMGGGYYD